MKGYKGFNQDLTCRGFQYEIGKAYKCEGGIELCSKGFHFCRKLENVHNFYDLKKSRVCEIEADGRIIDDGKKSVCSRIKIIRELSRAEVLAKVNTGEENTGVCNSGYGNSGNGNSGDRNSGSFCACDYSSGIFMTKKIMYEAFNKQLTEREYQELINSKGFQVLHGFKLYSFKTCTEKNGRKHTEHLSYKSSWRMFWQTLTPQQKLTIKRMPHFDTAVFYEITGIKV